MKGEDKMKQTIMGIGLIVGVLVGFVPSVDAQTQKKPVDIEACRKTRFCQIGSSLSSFFLKNVIS